jgi:2,4-dienoyl-CoA reductase-like NADH-dependent reductase (Old Yellow Enzyme family)
MRIAQPLRLPSGLSLRHRVAKAAMTEGLADRTGRVTPGLELLYRRWAAGGAALLVTGNVMVDGRYLERAGNVVVEDGRDASLDGWAAAARSGGGAALVQLSHPGRQTVRYVAGRPLAPSDGPSVKLLGSFAAPRAMTASEIEDVVERFGFVAAASERAGFDGVQVHAAHGYLLSQFLSPLLNRRDDAWGGTLENRARLLLEVVRAVRRRTSRGFTLAVKLNSADFQRGGFDEADALGVVAMLERERIDLLEISGGSYEAAAFFGLAGAPESTRRREAYFLGFARRVREASRLPLMVTGGFRSAAAMEDALAEGALDVVGLARPLLLDPSFPAKLLGGVAARVDLPALGVKRPSLATLAEAGWYDAQVQRLARGDEPDRGLSPRWAMASYLAKAAVRGVRHRLSYRPPAAAPARAGA